MFLDFDTSYLVQNNLSFLYFLDLSQMVTFRKSEFSDSHSMHSTSSRPNKYQSPSSLTIPAVNKQGKGLHFSGVKTAVAIIRQQKQELQPPLRGPMSMCKPNVHPDLHSSVNSHLNHSSYFDPNPSLSSSPSPYSHPDSNPRLLPM